MKTGTKKPHGQRPLLQLACGGNNRVEHLTDNKAVPPKQRHLGIGLGNCQPIPRLPAIPLSLRTESR
ncbi:MAG: hypothetical protein HOO93_05720 [Methyloglobulus sp.]|nr:hypothetical protein [Methyloglobulus sp.]